MAFPFDNNLTNSSETSPTTSHTVTLPASATVGSTIMLFFVCDDDDNTTSVTWPATYNEILDSRTPDNAGQRSVISVAWHKYTGSEGSTITVTTSTSQVSNSVTFFTGRAADPNLLPPEASSAATGTSTSPDSASLTPSGSGARDYYWISLVAVDHTSNINVSAGPTGYASRFSVKQAPGCGMFMYRKLANATSEDPDAWTLSSSDAWAAYTLVIYPQDPSVAEWSPPVYQPLDQKQKTGIQALMANQLIIPPTLFPQIPESPVIGAAMSGAPHMIRFR